jgi:hypothetical protein
MILLTLILASCTWLLTLAQSLVTHLRDGLCNPLRPRGQDLTRPASAEGEARQSQRARSATLDRPSASARPLALASRTQHTVRPQRPNRHRTTGALDAQHHANIRSLKKHLEIVVEVNIRNVSFTCYQEVFTCYHCYQ